MSAGLLLGTTACSSSGSDSGDKPAPADSSATTPGGTPTTTDEALPDLAPANVVTALTGAGYKCSNDGTYAICTTGPVAVWVLTGDHKRPPQYSLHSAGPAETATAAVSKALPQALEIAHINPRTQIVDWFGQQSAKPTAQTDTGDWQVSWSVESAADTDEPGVHLTLSDKLCKTNCQAE